MQAPAVQGPSMQGQKVQASAPATRAPDAAPPDQQQPPAQQPEAQPAPQRRTIEPPLDPKLIKYYLVLGSFPDSKAAHELQTEVSDRHYSGVEVTKQVDSGQREWYEVRMGAFKDLSSASDYAREFTRHERIQALVRDVDKNSQKD